MKRILFLAIVFALAIPAVADARGFLPKWEARSLAKDDVRELAQDVGADYWLERAAFCQRLGRMRVECDFQTQYADGINCDDTIVVRLYRNNTYRSSYPYDPDCWGN